MRNIFNHLLAFLCLVDLVVIMTNLVFSLSTLQPEHTVLTSLLPWSDGLCHIAVTCSVFLTLAITGERYQAVYSPYSYQARLDHWWLLSAYTIPLVMAAVLLNTPKILHLIDARVIKDIFRHHSISYIKFGIIYQIFHPLSTTCIVPIIILCFLNYKIFKGSRRLISSSSTADISLAKIIMTVVSIFIILTIPKVTLALYEVSTIPDILECHRRKCRYYISSQRWMADSIIRYLVMLNSSINFIIYCFVGTNFRQTLIRALKSYGCRCSKEVQEQKVEVRVKKNSHAEEEAADINQTVETESYKRQEPYLLVSTC